MDQEGNMRKYLLDWKLHVVLCLTIGLMPYVPEPHIVGKLRWLAGGGAGMKRMDWLDVFWHAWPWLVLLFVLAKNLIQSYKSRKVEGT